MASDSKRNRRSQRRRDREREARQQQSRATEPANESSGDESSGEDEAPVGRGRRARRPVSRRRAVMFRVLAVLFPLILVAAVNWGLYLFDVGYDTSLVVPVPQVTDRNTFQFNEQADYAYYPRRVLAGPEPRYFRLPKGPATYRVVCVGASTVQGFPYPTAVAFPRQLEVILSRQMPQRRVEVLNAGIVGVNSFALVDVVRQAVDIEPDLIIVYAGHNEFYGPGGVGSEATSLSPALYPWLVRLRRFRLMQVLHRTLGEVEEQTDEPLMATLPRDIEIPLDSDAYQAAVRYYRENLERIAEMTGKADVPLLLCGVASNLSNQGPLRSLSNPGLTDDQRRNQDARLARARELLERPGEEHAEQALGLMEEAAEVDPGSARIAYRRGQALARLERGSEAAEAFRRARDLDGCRFRAPSVFAEVAEEVGAGEGRTYVDLADHFQELSDESAPGFDYFLEHVHFNLDGHRAVARRLARTVVEEIEGAEWNPAAELDDEELNDVVGVTPYDDMVALWLMLTIVDHPPLNEATDHRLQARHFAEQLQERIDALEESDRTLFDNLSDELRYTDLVNGLGAAYLARGQAEEALAMFERAERRQPWRIEGYVGSARALTEMGRHEEAVTRIEQAMQLSPGDPDLLQIHRLLSSRR